MFWRKDRKSSALPAAGKFTLGSVGPGEVGVPLGSQPSNADLVASSGAQLVGKVEYGTTSDASRLDAPTRCYVIPKGYRISGASFVPGTVRIDGEFWGKKLVATAVEVSAGARVSAPIEAQTVRVAGLVCSSVDAKGRVELQSTGTISGDELIAQELDVEVGGTLECASLSVG